MGLQRTPFRRFFKYLCLPALLVSTTLAQDLMPLDQIKPGMKGKGRTVFSGYQPEEFDFEVVEVLRDFYPRRNLILIRLDSENARFTGVAAGMSGSPIYIDGKLAGALSYSISVFLKQPLAGVTPIHEMLEIIAREAVREQELAAFTPASDSPFLEMALGLAEPSWESFIPKALLQRRMHAADHIKPLPLPLAFSGFQSRLVEQAAGLLQPAGLVAVSAGTLTEEAVTADQLVPGAAISAVLLRGDASIDAIGTVTYRQGNRVLAFGHPFFDVGPVAIPVALAKILTVVPSELSAFKIGASAGVLGTLRQDRTTGIYAEVGSVANLVPLAVTYTDETGRQIRFTFEFSDERAINTLMPLVLRFVLVNTLESARLATGENSLQLDGELRLRDGAKIKLANFYPGMLPLPGQGFLNGILQATGEIAAALGTVMANDLEPVKIAGVALHFTSLPGWRYATVEQVWLDRSLVEAGDSINVFARVKAYRGPEVVVQQRLVIPAALEGNMLTVTVGGSRELTRQEQQFFPGRFSPRSFAQLAALLNERRRNDAIYFQLSTPDRGLIVEGDELSSLPPTAFAILQAQNLKGNTSFARQRVLAEVAQPVAFPEASTRQKTGARPYAISGMKTIRVRVK
ncbi:MAG: hypothetical protein ONB48_21285 [candidate division KSB1 bacterium]|nr:hypothetical protein [candidate division KSB1 bacterium]MDZ7288182.1 hypothetical protein [candidate division KSB1 bacterium]MDZ7300305.1 hypothetical protein [candidate division KSB1 bacterium]MDZ7308726.1 hypothetical protein [candidate division KSB1 bacterium]MDZ7351305.1 hypothetical protein [candidate division KSB1 bacterium]